MLTSGSNIVFFIIGFFVIADKKNMLFELINND